MNAKKIAKLFLSLVLLAVVLFLLAGRPIGELVGLLRASADVAVDNVVDNVPVEVRDRRLDHNMQLQRRQLTDHQVALNLSRRELDTLVEQVQQLEERGARRQRLLGEAYPVLQQATVGGWTEVDFAGAKHTLADFQRNIDQLLAEQEREGRQLAIRGAGLAKLKASVTDGERALADMRNALLVLEQEVDLLRTRREQAESEGRTLDLVTAVNPAPAGTATTQVGDQAEQLRQDVSRLEAGNEARRAAVPAAASPNHVARDWERLERLKAIHAKAEAPAVAPATPATQATPVTPAHEGRK